MKRLFACFVPFAFALVSCLRESGSGTRWSGQASATPSLRIAPRAELARQPEASRTLVGGEIAAGSEMRFSIHPELNRIFFGEAMGLEARGRYLRSVEGPNEPALIQTGLAFTSYVLVGRTRVAAPFAILIPEIGYAWQRPRHGWSLRWSAPVAVLATERLSVEVAPSLTLLDPAPRATADWLLGIGVGVGFRDLRTIPIRDPGYDVMIVERLCREFDPDVPRGISEPLADLASVRPYRRYTAVTRVGAALPHFALSYGDLQGPPLVVAAVRERDGKLRLEPDPAPAAANFPPTSVPIPPELRDFAAAVSAQFTSDCHVYGVRAGYLGTYRDVVVEEMVRLGPAYKDAVGVRGFRRRHRLVVDADLTRVRARTVFEHTPAALEVPASARWLPSAPAASGKLSEALELSPELDSQVLQAGHAFVTGADAPLSSVVSASDAVVPSELVTHLIFTLTLTQNLQSAPTAANAESHTSLELRGAVFGPQSSGESAVSLDGERYRVKVKLTSNTPYAAVPGYRTETYAGTLELRVEDEHGRSFHKTMPVSGLIELDGPGVVAALGLEIPTYLARDTDENPLLGLLAERGPLPRVRILVSSNLRAEEFE